MRKYPWPYLCWATCCLFMALYALVFADIYCRGRLLPHPPTDHEILFAWVTAFGFVLQALGWFWVAREKVDAYYQNKFNDEKEKDTECPCL
jgi:hypothetical protein